MNAKSTQHRTQHGFQAAAICFLFCLATSFTSVAQSENSKHSVGPGKVVVKTALGGFIFGYDIDRTGTEGVLAEALELSGNKFDIAIETFSQKTGKILKIVNEQTNTKNNWLALGIFGNSVGLAEFEHVTNNFVDNRTYSTLNPLNSNALNGSWTPPLTVDDIIFQTSASQGFPTTALLYFDNTGNNFSSYLLSSNIGANTFGSVFQIPDPTFNYTNSPVLALNTATNQAVLGGSEGCFGCTTEIGQVNLTTGDLVEFEGLGFGTINGIAVDSSTGIACTSTEDDFSIEFYNLATQAGTIVVLPNATDQSQSGQSVAVDSMHGLFLVSQEFSSTARSGSSIQVFDEQGNFVESINGLSLPASPVPLAINPAQRSGFFYAGTSLQSFTY